MNDTQFLTKIIGEICDYAVSNGMEPNDTLSTVADNIKMLLEISTFNAWQYKNPEGQDTEKKCCCDCEYYGACHDE